MKRHIKTPRPNWQTIVEGQGLVYHTDDQGKPYWNESAYYSFSSNQITELEYASNVWHEMLLLAGDYIIEHKLYERLGIPAHMIPIIEDSWEAEPPSLYSRFDAVYDGINPPKLLEYNADTPTSILEAAVVQWKWKEDCFARQDQYNSLYERLVDKWKDVASFLRQPLYFIFDDEVPEDRMNVALLAETAIEANINCIMMHIGDVGYNEGERQFRDIEENEINSIFKLYPWEWIANEEFGQYVPHSYWKGTIWMEPAWKMLWSNKGILPLLYELFPNSPYLLPAFTTEEEAKRHGAYVKKPILSREGANTHIYINGRAVESTGGDYGEEGYIYQKYAPLPVFDGQHPVLGLWMVDGVPAGMGIRESPQLITSNTSKFIPHIIF
jgi:glutathionylspermidine synthase